MFGRTPDGLVDLTGHQSRLFALDLLGAFQGPADVATHDKALKAARDAVDVFQTSDGPGGGALACVWSLRTILHDALGYWVTRTDGTEDFGAELQGDYRKVFGEPDVLPGGIVISPTQVQAGTKKRIVGHVGILGAGAGDARKIYSNSSRRKVWSQNYTVATWKAYQLPRGLDVLFYPLPMIR